MLPSPLPLFLVAGLPSALQDYEDRAISNGWLLVVGLAAVYGFIWSYRMGLGAEFLGKGLGASGLGLALYANAKALGLKIGKADFYFLPLSVLGCGIIAALPIFLIFVGNFALKLFKIKVNELGRQPLVLYVYLGILVTWILTLSESSIIAGGWA